MLNYEYRKGDVYIQNRFAGIIAETDEGYIFRYSGEYLQSSHAIPVSLTLPLTLKGKKRNIRKKDISQIKNWEISFLNSLPAAAATAAGETTAAAGVGTAAAAGGVSGSRTGIAVTVIDHIEEQQTVHIVGAAILIKSVRIHVL